MSDYQTTIERIRMILNVSESSPLDDLRALADEYAAACLDVNERLSECAKFLRVGNSPEALRLAETAPSVLDLCNLLDFPERADWADVCQTYRLTRATVPNAATLEQLNRAFEELIPIDNLLRRHRFLALARASLGERLDVLYSLAERDVANMIWPDSIPPLEKAFDVETESDFRALEREPATPEGMKKTSDYYRRLTDVRRVSPAPKALIERVKKYLEAAATQAFADRFQAFDASARAALASGDVDAEKRTFAEGSALFSAAKNAGASAPRLAFDVQKRLETALRENESNAILARRFQQNVERWREEIAQVDSAESLNKLWAQVVKVVGKTGVIPRDLLALRDEKETEFFAAAKRKKMIVVAAAVGGAVLFLLAAAGVASLLI